MKRKLALLLAALMLTSCLSPALAADGGPEDEPPAEAAEESQSLYDRFGPWGAWTDEQKTAAESWTDDDWSAYWSDYEAAVYVDDEQYWEDEWAWQQEQYGYGDSDYEEALRQEKADMGMPYPDGPNVFMDGACLDFGGTAPVMDESGYVLLPFRPFLEALGAEVGYADGRATAVLPGGGTLEVKASGEFLTYTVGDKISMARMYAAPVARDGVLYVESQALAEALGLSYYRDYWYDTVTLADLSELKAEIDAEFTHMNALLAAGAAALDPARTYATTAVVEAAGTLYGDKEHRTATATTRTSGLTGPNGSTTDTTVKVDLGGIGALLKDMTAGYGVDGEEITDWLREVNGTRVQTITDRQGGSRYEKGSLPSTSSYGFSVPQDTWMRYGMAGDGSDFLDDAVTVGDLLLAGSGISGGGYGSDPAGALRETADFLALFVGDGALKLENTGTTNTYTADVGQADFLKAMKLLLGDGYLTEEEIEEMYASAGFHFTMKVREQGGKVQDMEFGLDVHLGGIFPVTISAALSGTPLSVQGSASVVGEWLGKLDLKLTADSRLTTETVPTAPPDGEKVRDYEEAYREYWEQQGYEWVME